MPDATQRHAVFDTSVWINLFATERVDTIITAMGILIDLPPQVLRELRRHPVTNQTFNKLAHPIIDIPLVPRSTLVGEEAALFLELVAASPPNGLGDGEAASIAIAVHRNALIALDENKARRILLERFPDVAILRSEDILNDRSVIQALGEDDAKSCFEKACRFGRMHVRSPKA